VSAHLVGDVAKRREVDDPWICRPASDEDLGPKLDGLGPNRFHVDQAGDGIDSVTTASYTLPEKFSFMPCVR
jgi:hypothetical protein